MFSIAFWRRAGELAIRSAAQAALLCLGASAATGEPQVSLWLTDWPTVAGFAGGAAVLSLLTSLAATGFGEPNRPTVVD